MHGAGAPGDRAAPAGLLRRRSPVAGLDRGKLSGPQVLAQSVSAVAPSAAMATTPALVVAAAGTSALWSVGVAAAIAWVVACCVAQFARRMAAPGSLYSFTAKGLGPLPGFLCGCALLVGYAFLTMAALVGWGMYAHALAVRAGWSALPAAPTVAVLVPLAAIGVGACVVRGVRLSARVVLMLEAASIAVVLAVLAVLLARGGAGPTHAPTRVPARSPTGDPAALAAGVVPALAAFIGFESAAALGAEARRPFRSVPRALPATVLGAAGLFLLATCAQLLGVLGTGEVGTITGSPTGHRLGVVLDVGLATSFLACALAAGTALARLLFSLGREEMTPAVLGRVHPRHRTPHVAVAVAVPVLIAVPVALLALGRTPRSVFATLVGMFTYGHMLAYLLVCVAAPVFLYRIGELTVWPVVAAALVVPVLVLVPAAYSDSLAPGADRLLPGSFVLLMTAGLGWYCAMRVRRPQRARSIGVYDETTADDVFGFEPAGGRFVTATAADG